MEAVFKPRIDTLFTNRLQQLGDGRWRITQKPQYVGEKGRQRELCLDNSSVRASTKPIRLFRCCPFGRRIDYVPENSHRTLFEKIFGVRVVILLTIISNDSLGTEFFSTLVIRV